MLSLIRAHLTQRELLIDSAFMLALLLAWVRPAFGQSVFRKIEVTFLWLSKRKGYAILFITLLPIVIRVCLLPLIPIPVPEIHDEFSYLLAADTFAHGRLANPPHPMWLFFDTIHVNQHPTYTSKYPPAQGIMLALGQITTGHPWAGVVLSVGVMCGAVLWMLQGWLPPQWALLGSILFVLRVGIFSYWMNSYWGGAVAAIGGSLVLGALPRVVKSQRIVNSAIMGLGAGILLHSRPLEGLILCLGVAAFLLQWFVRRHSYSSSITVLRVLLPCCLLILLALGFAGYYNLRTTGKLFLMPYALNEQNYWSTPTLLWQKARPPIHFSNPQFEEFYNVWSRNLWLEASNSMPKRAASIGLKSVYFFCWPELCVPLIGFILLLHDTRIRFLIFEVLLCFTGFLAVAWFQPHYAAPVVGAMFALFTQALRHLKHWSVCGRPVGIGLLRVVLVFSFLLAPFHPHSAAFRTPSDGDTRSMIESQLEAMQGKQLVIVRYASDGHNPLLEWVYNSADIDNSKVVWAREIPGQNVQALLDYFQDRRPWLVEPDSPHPILIPYKR